MTRVVSLGMYDPPWLEAENDALWAALHDMLPLAGLPDRLDRARPLEAILADPALLLAQTCGYPLLTSLAGQVRLVATPCYEFPGCDGPLYRSFLVVRADDPADTLAQLRGRRAAVNGLDSNSGHNAFRAAVAPLAKNGRFFAAVEVTGGHLASLAAVREGRADIAAIDCVTYGMAGRRRPELLHGLRVVGETAATPGLPLVTALAASDADVDVLFEGLAALPPRPGLGLVGFERLSLADYAPVVALEREAADLGYATLD